MQFYFGRANPQDIVDPDTTFAQEDDFDGMVNYWYGIEYGTGPQGLDGITIYDTAERSLPIDIDSVPSLILALEEVLQWYQRVDESRQVIEQVTDATSALAF